MTTIKNTVLADNAYGTLASSLTVTDTTLAFTTGHGARFPVVSSGQSLYCCILNSGNILEEIKITAHTSGSDSATITRCAGGTTAKAWSAGDRIEARWSSSVAEKVFSDIVSVKDFDAEGDGVTDDTANIIAALTSLSSGGALYFPAGTYIWRRGTGSLLADTIAAGNIRIYGDCAASVISCTNGAGATPNNGGNEFYNVFQATSKNNITIENLSVEGYTCLGYFDSCDNITIRNVLVNGLLANAGGYLVDKSIYTYKCSNVKINGSTFKNCNFPVYLSGDATTRTANVKVLGNTFEHNVAAGSFTATFPAQVYAHYADDVTVSGANHFKNIYSSVDNGDAGSGMGYGVYEGDGACKSITVNYNTFDYTGNGSKNATAIYVNEALSSTINGNTITADADGRLSFGIRMDAKDTNSIRVVNGNTLKNLQTDQTTQYGIYLSGTDTANVVSLNVDGNIVHGFVHGVRVDAGIGTATGSSIKIGGNTMKYQLDQGVRLDGVAGSPLKFPKINDNEIIGSNASGIYMANYVVSASIQDNTILDGNLDNAGSQTGAAILFETQSFGSVITGNTIGNTPGGAGLFVEAVANASNVTSRIFKDVTANNNLIGFAGTTSATEFLRFPTVSPTVGIFDIEYGDFIQNNTLNAGGVPGWHCVNASKATLTANATSASTTVVVADTTGYVAGDIVLLLKNANPYDADYYTATEWHADTIASVTNATDFVLTTGIPAGDGTYVSGTAIVKRARFRAAAAIAA